MKHNTDVIYYHLLQKHHLEYKKALTPEEELGRPRYYDGSGNREGFLYLLSEPEEEPIDPGTYLCYKKPAMKDPDATTLFLLSSREDPREVYNELQNIYDYYDAVHFHHQSDL